MTRIDVVPAKGANPLVRFVYRLSRRQFGRDMDPIAVYAHAPGLLIGYGMFEQATGKQHRADERLKVPRQASARAWSASCRRRLQSRFRRRPTPPDRLYHSTGTSYLRRILSALRID